MNQDFQEFTIKGMDCANCARTVEKGVGQLEGVDSYELSFASEKLRLQGSVTPEEVVKRVRELGYDAVVAGDPAAEQPQSSAATYWQFMWQRPETRSALIGLMLILPGLIFTEILGIEHVAISVASGMAMVIAGWPVAQSA